MPQNRFLLIFSLFAVLGVILHIRLGFAAAWYLYAGAGLLLVSYLLFGDVWKAYNTLKKGQPEQAEKTLDSIYFPNLLLPRHRAYYHFTRGMLFLQAKKIDIAETHLLSAEKIGLGQQNDQALLLLNLAHLNYVNRRFDQSRHYLDKAKQHATSDLLIKDNLKKLEQALAKA